MAKRKSLLSIMFHSTKLSIPLNQQIDCHKDEILLNVCCKLLTEALSDFLSLMKPLSISFAVAIISITVYAIRHKINITKFLF